MLNYFARRNNKKLQYLLLLLACGIILLVWSVRFHSPASISALRPAAAAGRDAAV
jgi:hypothetical protein